MQQYTKNYLNKWGFTEVPPCEVCKERAADIHHIFGRIGEDKNEWWNLVALCRDCHSDQKILNAIKSGYQIAEEKHLAFYS